MAELVSLFQSVAAVMRQHQEAFNQADRVNGNHGDHMLEIFELASSSVAEREDQPLADSMEVASQQLLLLDDNGSARVYADGLSQFAAQFREHDISTADLVGYAQELLAGETQEDAATSGPPAGNDQDNGDVLKALVAGLAGWRAVEKGEAPPSGSPDIGYMFDLGIAYMQAKARGGSRTSVIADAAVSVSPLGEVPHRAESGKLAIQAFLEAMF